MAMTAKKSERIQIGIIIVLTAVIAGLLYYMIPYRYRLNAAVGFDPDLTVTGNPLMGYAPFGSNTKKTEDTTMVYIEVLWSEWEPEEGVYDIEALEEKYHIPEYKEEGKNAVIRFVADKPGDEEHMDIPEWLYNKTDGDGFFYDDSNGCGYSPNYENETLIAAHEAAIKALADYCNEDSFVAFVQLGSLGHWGEWHVKDEDGYSSMPNPDVCWEYVDHYTQSFENVKFLMRRSYEIAEAEGFGLYNDVTGDAKQTDEWLNWTREGGTQETLGDDLDIVPYEDFWMNGPVGGEFASELDWEDMSDEELEDVFRQMDESHVTYLGPNTGPDDAELRRRLLNHMGYRIYVSELSTKFSFADNTLKVNMTWENKGVSTFAFDWEPIMYVYNKDGDLLYWESVDIQLSQLGPTDTVVTENSIPYTDELRDGYTIGLRITDESGDRVLRLAYERQEEPVDGVEILYRYNQDDEPLLAANPS